MITPQEAFDYIKRHGTLALLIISTWLLVGASKMVTLQTALTIATFEGIAILLTYIVLYVLSPIKWMKELEDEIRKQTFERNKSRFTAALVVVSTVFASVHFLVGAVVFGVYFTMYKPIP